MRVVLVIAVALVILAGLYNAMSNSRALADAEQQLVEFDRELKEAANEINHRESDANQLVAETIQHAIEGHTRLLTTMARQHRPGAEWSSTAVNVQTLQVAYEESFTDFVGNPRHREAFPQLASSVYYRLGQLQFLSGNNATAIHSLNHSISLAAALHDEPAAGLAENTKGCVHAALGDYDSALEDFQSSLRRLSSSRGHEIPAALSLRNIGLVQRALGADGLSSLRLAVEMLSDNASDSKFTYANELLIDVRMALCEMYWERGELDFALEQCERSRRELLMQLELTKNFGKPGTVRNRYINASRLIERNLAQLRSLSHKKHADDAQIDEELVGVVESDAARADHLGLAQSGRSTGGWQWQPLFDLTTELVSTDLSVTATMSAEFDLQNGLLIGWGMYDWTKQVVVDIAKRGWDRCTLVILADNDESLNEARSSLHEAGVPLSEITFGICAHETSWFRDGGPIVGKAIGGESVWFDSMLTRHDLPRRLVTDSLPSLISDDWRTRVARTPIHIEGGMLMSNGRGLTVIARPLLEINRRYGFKDAFIERELKRVTGASNLVMVDSMIDEPTGHLDMFMTFVDPRTIVVGQFLDRPEPNGDQLDRIADSLSRTIVDGQNLNVVRIPMPKRRAGLFAGRNTGVFRSYTNVIYLNGVLLVPSYEGEAEEQQSAVRDIYQRLLPNWEVAFIDCSRTSQFGGALHCLVSNLGDTPFVGEPQP